MFTIAPRPALITRLILQDFRTYADLDLAVGRQLVALVGENGAGKTNLLEALSLFMPGRGLRRADIADMARHGGPRRLRDFADPRYGVWRTPSGDRVSNGPIPRRERPGSAGSTAPAFRRPRPSPNICASSG